MKKNKNTSCTTPSTRLQGGPKMPRTALGLALVWRYDTRRGVLTYTADGLDGYKINWYCFDGN